METVSKFRDWVVTNWEAAQAGIAPYVAWLPEDTQPLALPVLAAIGIALTVYLTGKQLFDMCRAGGRVIATVWRAATGREKPKRPEEAAAEDAKVAREESEKTNLSLAEIRALLEERRPESGDNDGAPIDRAMAAIEEILSSNEPAKQKARDAIRTGELSVAEEELERIFTAETENLDRLEDRTIQFRREAARTAREKAALAATRSVAEGAAWYAKATELDPTDFSTWINLSRLHRSSGNIGAAFDAADRAGAVASDDRERHVANNDKGTCLLALGNLTDALKAFDTARALMEPLAASDPSNTGWQRDLSVSHEKIGDLEEARGDVAAAAAAYERSLPIAADLAARFPDHPQFQGDIDITHRRLAALRARAEGG